ncbi:ORF204 [Saltwater crocodilepox virus]|nr:hypothetical protein [Saltwater crocodilepox virus]QGT47287.1 ORF204 [Saltwater crocodilepox virus]QGT47504.1 ORF204 [Saltwater crocodilepox virus]QGT47718.1 ORF201 [Saltwater crocodilepox virus]QGT47931.1 ORF204 [Saltwater crocodilepox virus]
MLSAIVTCLALVLTLLLIYRSLWNIAARLLFRRQAVQARPFLLAACRGAETATDEAPNNSSTCSAENDRRGPAPGPGSGSCQNSSSCLQATQSSDVCQDKRSVPSVVCASRRRSLPILEGRRSPVSRRRASSGDARFRGRARERSRNNWRSRSRSRSPSDRHKRRLFAEESPRPEVDGTSERSNRSSNGFESSEAVWTFADNDWPSYKICLIENVNGRSPSCVLPLRLPNPLESSDVGYERVNGFATEAPRSKLEFPKRRIWSDIDQMCVASAGAGFDEAGACNDYSDDFSADSLDDAVLDTQLMSSATTRQSSPSRSTDRSRADSPLSRSLQKACSDVEDLRNHFMEMIDCLLREDVRVTVPCFEDATSDATCSVLLTESGGGAAEFKFSVDQDRAPLDASVETAPRNSSTGLDLGARPKERDAERRCAGLRRTARWKRDRLGNKASRTPRIKRSNIWL